MLIYGKYSYLGLDIGSSLIKLVQLKREKKGLKLSCYGFIETPKEAVTDGKIIDPAAVAVRLKVLLKRKHFKGNRVVTSISEEYVIFRHLVLPKMSFKELMEVMKYEAQKYINVPLKEVIYDWFPLRYMNEGEMEVLFVAAPRSIIQGYMEVMIRAGLYPVGIEVDVLALVRNFHFYMKAGKNTEGQENKSSILLNIGTKNSNMVIIEGRRYCFSRTVPLRGSYFTGKVMETDNMLWEKVEYKKKDPDLLNYKGSVSAAVDLVKEIQRTIEYYLYQVEDGEINLNKIFIMGGPAGISRLNYLISSELKIETLLLHPLEFIKYESRDKFFYIKEDMNYFNIAVGLALRRWQSVKY
ncbi:MAG: hypothetical protein CVU88_02885 [Firmicutes bacterium HGW-Firmicutes-13]|nr:MAG: hypothetical protein CVU88_02885 [Firmicutes bacterium HGW-Firmicutes-13]